ncbi:MAG: hypothetical protein WBK99_06240, partial [Solirubrobacterales bacterium]
MLTAPGSRSFTYDPQGRTTGDTSPAGQSTYAYDSLDRLKSKTTPDGQSLDFSYDAFSRLTTTTGDGLTRTYAYALDDRPIFEQTQIGRPGLSAATRTKAYNYGPQGLLSTRVNDSTPTYPVADEHGSVLAELTESGEIENPRDYDPFGVELEEPQPPDPADATSALDDSSFDYLGAHGRAGLYGSDQIHMGARLFDPSTGRFTSRDPEPGAPTSPQS